MVLSCHGSRAEGLFSAQKCSSTKQRGLVLFIAFASRVFDLGTFHADHHHVRGLKGLGETGLDGLALNSKIAP